MTTLYDINTRNRGEDEPEEMDIPIGEVKRGDEPEYMDNDLEERLYSAKNLIDLAILALYTNSHYLLPTAIEETYYKLQKLVDDYCVINEE